MLTGSSADNWSAELRQSDPLTGFEPSLAVGEINLTLIPEPATAAMLSLGLAGLGAVDRSRRRAPDQQAV